MRTPRSSVYIFLFYIKDILYPFYLLYYTQQPNNWINISDIIMKFTNDQIQEWTSNLQLIGSNQKNSEIHINLHLRNVPVWVREELLEQERPFPEPSSQLKYHHTGKTGSPTKTKKRKTSKRFLSLSQSP